uniref:Midasin n=1 Tax=Trichuris muris TaxID=70415 RepID=A0A5S6QIN1_TRIMR
MPVELERIDDKSPSESAFINFARSCPTDSQCVAYAQKFTTTYGALRHLQDQLESPNDKVAFCRMVSRMVSHLPEAKRFAREWLPEYFAEILNPGSEEYLASAIESICLIFFNDERYFASAIEWSTIDWLSEQKWLPTAKYILMMAQSKLNVSSQWMESYMQNRLQLDGRSFLLNRTPFLYRPVLLVGTKADETEKSVQLVAPNCVAFGGRCLPSVDFERCSCKKFESYVAFPSTTMVSLAQITSAVLQNRPVLIQGPTGCGKSSIVRYFAHCVRRCDSLVTIQASDQMDTKACFGSYHFTEIPGEFEWKLGPFSLAALEGNWVLVEDVDLAPLDFLQQLASILESGKVYLPGRSSVELHSKFHLFATMRIENGTSSVITSHDKAAYLSMFPTIIDLPDFAEDQVVHIASLFHPDVNKFASRYVQLLSTVKNSSLEESMPPIRKLINYMKRLVSQRCFEDVDGLFRNAMDCVVAHVRSPEQRKQAALSIGAKLNMTEAMVDFNCDKYYPKVALDDLQVRIGRATLPIAVDHIQHRKRSFATTRSASCLLEQIAVCVQTAEPVLLVGETGCGKTAAVQFLADVTGNNLRVVNMSYQTEAADLTGGYKPVRLRALLTDLKRRFEQLFAQCFANENENFFKTLNENVRKEKWRTVLKMMLKVSSKALQTGIEKERWTALKDAVHKWCQVLRERSAGLAFQYAEGVLMKAIQNGEWILLDEVNMASEELLCWLHVVLDCSAGDQVLLDASKQQSSVVNANFRLFACMNPATDVGKRELPTGLRSLFTEIYVDDITDPIDVHHLVTSYLSKTSFSSDTVNDIAQFYQHVRQLASTELKSNCPGKAPCFNLRNLCRSLLDVDENRFRNKTRSLYEAFCLGFLTGVDAKSYESLKVLIGNYTIKRSGRNIQPIFTTKQRGNLLDVCGFPIVMGSLQPYTKPEYVLSKSVTRNLEDLCRVVSARRFPVLLQGETSVGKTSMIQFLASLTGNVCVRINNHQNTDVQDYTGSYVTDSSGKFVFVEGPLVKAMRAGYWIILDELNLAEPDVLEALNRVLDDNRELFIPETQEVVSAHENFILFATQNPPGAYSGRKTLSRALKSRFVEINFNELPYDELADILAKSSHLPPSYAGRMVAVMRDLQVHRSYTGCLSGSQSYITLRDLFRWGQRFHLTGSRLGETRDWDQFLADQGFFLLGGRSRLPEDEAIVAQVLEKHFRRSINPENLFSIKSAYFPNQILQTTSGTQDWQIVWTNGLIRMTVLVYQALLFGEAVLMVGETGCAKTTLCQMLTKTMERELVTINCHMSTEAADFVGRIVPSPAEKANCGALFEWQDGCLVRAMKEGAVLLIDEISLAEDSVLERLNSVLEPERSLVLYEKCSAGQSSSDVVTAEAGFAIVATMNPGGDYGKRELSRALRNRFTEIWCESTLDIQCSEDAAIANLNGVDDVSGIGCLIVKYFAWLAGRLRLTSRFTMRDVVTWIQFIQATHSKLGLGAAIFHGGMTLLDSVALQSSGGSPLIRKQLHEAAKQFLLSQGPMDRDSSDPMAQAVVANQQFGISPFFLPIGPLGSNADPSYCFSGPTCRDNAFRILRAITLEKPILLEGSPGVGKSSLVIAIAKAAGYPITRINLSEHTDLNDLFGMDMPVVLDNGRQTFAWKDGPLLSAIKNGHWVLLDEMNLASQTVLEGLNSCFDHRGEIFIPELGRLFSVDRMQTRFFAAQNPTHQGGSRKALPKSFLSRFIVIHLDELQRDDIIAILEPFLQCEKFSEDLISRIVTFSASLNESVNTQRTFGQSGGPWEFNVRDMIRLCELVQNGDLSIIDATEIIYGYRFRTAEDRRQLSKLAYGIFGQQPSRQWNHFSLTDTFLHARDTSLTREASLEIAEVLETAILPSSLSEYVRAMMHCINMDFLTILVGKSRVGKSMLVRMLAGLCGQKLNVFYLTAETDVTELLGCYEQRSSTDCYVDQCMEEASKICDVLTWTWVTFHRLDMAIDVLSFMEKNVICRRKRSIDFCLFIISEVERLINQLWSSNLAENIASHLMVCAKGLKEKLDSAKSVQNGIRFEWTDSVLVKAIRSGEWILLENVNLCCSAVLERLNCLFEPDGELSVGVSASEATDQTIYKRNPKFRAFFTMNPDHGEIFRSVRNRGVEIYILDEDACFRDPIGSVLLGDEMSAYTREKYPNDRINEQVCKTEISELKEPPELLFHSPSTFLVPRLNMLARGTNFSTLRRDGCLFDCYNDDLQRHPDLLNIACRQLFYYSSLEDVLHRVPLLRQLDRASLVGVEVDRLDCFAIAFRKRMVKTLRNDSSIDELRVIAFDPRWFRTKTLGERTESNCNRLLFYLIFNWFHVVQFGKVTSTSIKAALRLQNMPRCWFVVVNQACLLLDYYNYCRKIDLSFNGQPMPSDVWFCALMYLSALYLCLQTFDHLQREQRTTSAYIEFWMLLRQLDVCFRSFSAKIGLNDAFPKAENVDETLSCEHIFGSLYDSFAMKSGLRLPSELWNVECRRRLLSFFDLVVSGATTNGTNSSNVVKRIKKMLLKLKKGGSLDVVEMDELISKGVESNPTCLTHPEPTLSTVASALLKCYAVSQGAIDGKSLDKLVYLENVLLNPRMFTNSPSGSNDAGLYEWLSCLTDPMPFESSLCLDFSQDATVSGELQCSVNDQPCRFTKVMRIVGLTECSVVASVLCKVFLDGIRPDGVTVAIGQMRRLADEAKEVMKFVWHLGAPLARIRCYSRHAVRQLLCSVLGRIGAAIDTTSVDTLEFGCNVGQLYKAALRQCSALETGEDDVLLEKTCFDVGYLYSWLATTLSKSLDPVLVRIAKQSALSKQVDLLWKELAVCSVQLMCVAGCPVAGHSFPTIVDMESVDRLRGKCAHPYFNCLLDALATLIEQQQQQSVCLDEGAQTSRAEMLCFEQLARHLCDFMNLSSEHLRSLFYECYEPVSTKLAQPLIDRLVQQMGSLGHVRKLIRETTGYPDIVAVLSVGLDMMLLALEWALVRLVRQVLVMNYQTVGIPSAHLEDIIPLSFEYLPFPVRDWRPPVPDARRLSSAGILRLLARGTVEPCRYGQVVALLRAQWSRIVSFLQRSNSLFEMKAESPTAEDEALEKLFSFGLPYSDEEKREPAETESFYLSQKSLVIEVFRKMTDGADSGSRLTNRELLFTSYCANFKPCEKWFFALDHFDKYMMGNHMLILDEVYRSLAGLREDDSASGCYSLAEQCSAAVEPLRSVLARLESEWPNNAILEDIQADVGRLLELPCSTALQVLLPALQSLLGRVEQWDQVARRCDKLSEASEPLRALLIEGRRRELSRWSVLLDDAEIEFRNAGLERALAFADIIDLCQTQAVPVGGFIKHFSVDIASLSVGHFVSYVRGVRLLLRHCASIRESPYWNVLANMCAYYSQYFDVVQKVVATARQPREKELKDLIRILKFNSLNWWALLDSVKHKKRQLFNIVKKYKQQLAQPLSVELSAGTVSRLTVAEIRCFPSVGSCFNDSELLNAFGDCPKIFKLYGKFDQLLRHVDMDASVLRCSQMLAEVAEMCRDTTTKLQRPVGCGEKEEGQKLFRRELTQRQKMIAALTRTMSDVVGLSYRKGHLITFEQMENAAFSMPVDEDDEVGTPKESHENYEALCRVFWTCMSYWMKVSTKNFTGVNDQVEKRTGSVMLGLSNICMNSVVHLFDALNTQRRSLENLRLLCREGRTLADDLRRKTNMREGRLCAKVLPEMRLLLHEARTAVSTLITLWKTAPDDDHGSVEGDSKWSRLAKLLHGFNPPIAGWTKQSSDFASCMDRLSQLQLDLDSICKEADQLCLCSAKHVDYVPGCQVQRFGKMLSLIVTALLPQMGELLKVVDGCRDGQPSFHGGSLPEWATKLRDACEKAQKCLQAARTSLPESADVDVALADETFQAAQLLAQNLHKRNRLLCEADSPAQTISKASSILLNANINELNALVRNFNESLLETTTASPRSLVICSALHKLCGTLEAVYEHSYKLTIQFCSFYEAFGQLVMTLYERGYVEPPPMEETDGGGETKFENFENAGMGEGEGVKDVTDEIEDMGQLEDLKKSADEPEEQNDRHLDDVETPIDVDDDFFGNLEDLDNMSNREDDTDDSASNSSEGDGSVASIEDRLDEVDNPNDEVLDPELWDTEEDEMPNLDQSSEAAQKPNDQLAAKEESNPPGDEQNLEDAQPDDLEVDTENEEENAEDAEDHMEFANEISDGGSSADDSETASDDVAGEEAEMVDQQSNEAENDEQQNECAEEKQTAPTSSGYQCVSDALPDVGEPTENVEQQQDGSEEALDQTALPRSSEEDGRQDNLKRKSTEEASSDQHRESASLTKRQKLPEEMKSVGDSSKAFMKDAQVEQAELEGADPTETDGNVFAHAADLPDHCDQVIDSATLDVVKSQNLEQVEHRMQEILDLREQQNVDREDVGVDSVMTETTERHCEGKSVKSEEENMEIDNDDDVGDDNLVDKAPSMFRTSNDFYELVRYFHSTEQPTTSAFEFPVATPKILNTEECLDIWTRFVRFTESLSTELCERLRAILVPTTASRLQGDYRTGKRLNIRKLIPFVASNFRQNKIWLRRTRKARRSYQIVIAIDSSSSMMDNRAKQMAIESLALISSALRRLEVGSVGVCKFGERAAVVQGLNFSELRTNVCNLLKCVPSFFSPNVNSGDFVGVTAPARLLIIVSDGRGLYAEGQDAMKQSIQELVQFGVFTLFIIIDQEHPGQSSIFDVKVPTFGDDGNLEIVSYLEVFPFPFYIILKRIDDLPGVVGDALCQWFQMVADL